MAEIKCNHCGAICDVNIYDGRCLECDKPFCSSPSACSAHYVARINDYLITGGLFNPEMALHDNVRDLLIEIRDFMEKPNDQAQILNEVK